MLRLGAIFVVFCMVLIAASAGALLYLLVGLRAQESMIIAISILTGLAIYNATNNRLRDRANLAAQIADPDAHYVGTPAPGASDGARIDLAQTRYQQNQVIPPASTTASSRTVGATDNGNSGGGAGAGVAAAGTSP